MSDTSSMPLEVIYHTIDIIALSGDTASLCSLSQSCKMLFRYSRSKLFETIVISGSRENKIGALYKVLTRKGNEELGSHVKCFKYYHIEKYAEIGKVISIINLLSKVEDLHLYSGYEGWDRFPERLQNALIDMLSLTSLEKVTIRFIDNFPLSVLWGCSGLKCLGLEESTFLPSTTSNSTSRQSLPHLLQLTADEGDEISGKCTKEISMAFDFTDLKSLSAVVKGSHDQANILKIIDISRSNLQHLRVAGNFYTFRGFAKCITDKDIGMPKLTSLELVMLPEDLEDQLHNEFSILESASAKLARLETINIIIRPFAATCHPGSLFSQCYIDEDKLRLFEEVMLRPGFGKLQRVTLRVEIECLLVEYEARERLRRDVRELKKVFGKIWEKDGFFEYSVGDHNYCGPSSC